MSDFKVLPEHVKLLRAMRFDGAFEAFGSSYIATILGLTQPTCPSDATEEQRRAYGEAVVALDEVCRGHFRDARRALDVILSEYEVDRDVVHVDYRGDPDPRPLAERAAASDAIPSDKDDAIAIVVERLRLMHRKILNTPLHRGSLPETDGPEAPAEWPLWRTLVAWSPVLSDYAVLVEKRLVALDMMRIERDAAVEKARAASFKPSAAERAFNRRLAVVGPRLTEALNDALAVLAEPVPDPSKPPSGVPVASDDDVCGGCGHPRRDHRPKRTRTNRANHPEGCACLLCADFVTVLPGAPTECSGGTCKCTGFVGPGVAKPAYGVDDVYRPDDARDWLEGVAAEMDAMVETLTAVAPVEGRGPDGRPEDDYTLGVRNRLRVLAARVRS